MRVFLVYPGHPYSTIDVSRGYQGALKRAGHEVFHIDHHTNVGFYRHACATWEEKNPEYKSGLADILWLSANDVIAKAVELLPLDLVIFVTGMLIHPRAYKAMKQLGIPQALILTESPYQDWLQKDLAQYVDITFTNDKASVDYLKQFCPTFYLPHSYDPLVHFPREVSDGYQHDVFFLGTLYDNRQRLFEAVDWEGIDVNIVGVLSKEQGDMVEVQGVMDNEELANHYSGSKIVLNPHKGKALTVRPYSLGPRTYEAAACGAFQLVSDNREELKEVFDGILPTFGNAKELEEKIRYFLAHEKEREDRARQARECVMPCSFDNRLKHILLPAIEEVL